MVIGLIGIPGATLGWFRGKAIGKAYRAIYEDMKKAGIELSKADLQLLIGQLNRNPKAVLDADSRPESRTIKEPHVKSLVAYLKFLRRCFYILLGLGVLAVISFQHFWPRK